MYYTINKNKNKIKVLVVICQYLYKRLYCEFTEFQNFSIWSVYL